jgi:hypothetical protein
MVDNIDWAAAVGHGIIGGGALLVVLVTWNVLRAAARGLIRLVQQDEPRNEALAAAERRGYRRGWHDAEAAMREAKEAQQGPLDLVPPVAAAAPSRDECLHRARELARPLHSPFRPHRRLSGRCFTAFGEEYVFGGPDEIPGRILAVRISDGTVRALAWDVAVRALGEEPVRL